MSREPGQRDRSPEASAPDSEAVDLLVRGEYEKWNSIRENNPDHIPNLQNADLDGVTFARNLNLSSANLEGANLQESRLKLVNLRQAVLRGADLSKAEFKEANLRGADLRGAIFDGAIFYKARLEGSKIQNTNITNVSLVNAHFAGANLRKSDFRGSNLKESYLGDANFEYANLSGVDLNGAKSSSHINVRGAEEGFGEVNFDYANLEDAKLVGAHLQSAHFSGANLRNADLTIAYLWGANMSGANLEGAKLKRAYLNLGNFDHANLSGANLTGADLRDANFNRANLKGANLAGCKIYGVNTWDLIVDEETIQTDLVITSDKESLVTIDNLQTAYFTRFILDHGKEGDSEIAKAMESLQDRIVLILGRFRGERGKVLRAIKQELRNEGYIPMLFEFDNVRERDLAETITILAGLSGSIIADLSAPNSIQAELEVVTHQFPSLPVQPLFTPTEGYEYVYPLFESIARKPQVLPVRYYDNLDDLIPAVSEIMSVVEQAKIEVSEQLLRGRNKMKRT